jgi:hypothetical protein
MSNDGRNELFLYLGAAFATLIGLFVLQAWYGTYIDVHYHSQLALNGPAEGMVTARESDQKQLAAGKVPIERAMQELAQRGRTGFGSVSPAASDDLSALAGWIRSPSFKPVVAHPILTPRAPEVAAAPAVTPTPEPVAAPAPAAPAKHARRAARAPR